MNITIIGTGYVGLVTGACLASTGNNVTCLDIDEDRVFNLAKGHIPFYEPELSDIVLGCVKKGTLKFTSSYAKACMNNIYFLCVGTPQKDDGSADLTSLQSVLSSLSDNIKEESYIFTKSTVPVGTNKEIQNFFDEGPKVDPKVFVASNPEFLREGSAVKDFMRPDRVIVGTQNPKMISIATDLYKPFSRASNKMIFMKMESAELTKYASNAFLATKISYMNEIANFSEQVGADIHEVRMGMGTDPRIGKDFLYSGIGYGGSCFPKDINALINSHENLGMYPEILTKVRHVNEKQLDVFYNKIKNNLVDLSKKNLLIWGASFKPNTDDIRDSMAIKLIKRLSNESNSIYLYDPMAIENAQKVLSEYKNIFYIFDKFSKIEDCHALIIATEWKEFWNPNFQSLTKLKDSYIFDGRNILNKSQVEEFKLNYIGVGT